MVRLTYESTTRQRDEVTVYKQHEQCLLCEDGEIPISGTCVHSSSGRCLVFFPSRSSPRSRLFQTSIAPPQYTRPVPLVVFPSAQSAYSQIQIGSKSGKNQNPRGLAARVISVDPTCFGFPHSFHSHAHLQILFPFLVPSLFVTRH